MSAGWAGGGVGGGVELQYLITGRRAVVWVKVMVRHVWIPKMDLGAMSLNDGGVGKMNQALLLR